MHSPAVCFSLIPCPLVLTGLAGWLCSHYRVKLRLRGSTEIQRRKWESSLALVKYSLDLTSLGKGEGLGEIKTTTTRKQNLVTCNGVWGRNQNWLCKTLKFNFPLPQFLGLMSLSQWEVTMIKNIFQKFLNSLDKIPSRYWPNLPSLPLS